MFSRKFKESSLGKKLDEALSVPYDKSKSHKNAISFSVYSLAKWELFRACMSRELLLMKRNSFIYVFKTTQVLYTIYLAISSFSLIILKLNCVLNLFFVAAYYCSNDHNDCFPEDSIGY